MAQLTTNYSLYKPESTDTYNHLVYDNPNMDTIDAAMKNNSDHGVDSASCIKSGTVHSVTRTNTSCPVFKFTATGDWNTGDTMDVDGTPVSVFLPNGTAPLTGCYVINTEVLAIISGTRVTLMCPIYPEAPDVPFDPTGSSLSSTNVEAALKELDTDITDAKVAYTDYTVTLAPNATVSPFTHYGAADMSAFLSGHMILGSTAIVTSSGFRAVTNIRSNTLYVFGCDAGDVTIRVFGLKL